MPKKAKLAKSCTQQQLVCQTGLYKRPSTSLRELPQCGSSSREAKTPSIKREGTKNESNDGSASSSFFQQIQPTKESAQRQTKQPQRLERCSSASRIDEFENNVAGTSSRRILRVIPRDVNPPAMYWFNAHQCAKCGMSFPIKQTMWKLSEHKRGETMSHFHTI